MRIETFFLRVESSVGTFRLPIVGEEIKDRKLELVFNWLVFEQDVTVKSIQTFAEVLKPCTNADIASRWPEAADVEDYALGDPKQLYPGDGMQFVEALEVGCFIDNVPIAFIHELDPDYKPGVRI